MSTHDQHSAEEQPKKDESALFGTDNEDQVIPGHTYDGIKEYDNPMPGWWVWTFWATIVFAVVYFVGITFFDFVDTYEEDLAQSVEDLEMIRHAYAQANPQFQADEATLQEFIVDGSVLDEGQQHYDALCAACHGSQGEGLIGPNLTDRYWVHGGSNVEVFDIITEGVPAKGMPAWADALAPEERAKVLAYIRSLEGTNPPNAKEPEGELYEES